MAQHVLHSLLLDIFDTPLTEQQMRVEKKNIYIEPNVNLKTKDYRQKVEPRFLLAKKEPVAREKSLNRSQEPFDKVKHMQMKIQ